LDWDASLAEFEKHSGRTEMIGSPPARLVCPISGGIGADTALAALGRERAYRLYSELFDEHDSQSSEDFWRRLEGVMRRFDRMRLQKRELLCLGSLEAQIEVNAYQRVIARPLESGEPAERPTYAANAIDGVAPGTSNGSLEFYVIPHEFVRVSAVVRDWELVHVHFEGAPISKQRQDQLKELLGTRTRDLKIIREQEENLEAVIAANAIGIMRSELKASIPKVAGTHYGWLATLDVDQALWESTARLLREGGFFGLCGEDPELISGLAFLGVASSVCRDKSELVAIGKEHGVDVEAICAKAKVVEAATGLRLVIEAKGEVLSII
jgi:hypothetical protein